MKVTVHTSNHLKLLHRPLYLWTFGALFELACLYFLLKPSASSNPWIAGVMLIGFGCLFALLGQIVITDFYKNLNVMSLMRQGLFGRKVIEYPLEEIDHIEIVEGMNKIFIHHYQIRLVLKSQVLYLTAEPLYTYGEAGNLANFIAQFLNVSCKYTNESII